MAATTGLKLRGFEVMTKWECLPPQFRVLLEQLADAANKVSVYCEEKSEQQLAEFFSFSTVSDAGLRGSVDRAIDASEPSFEGYVELASIRLAEKRNKKRA
jgi:hypothetical protein